MKKCPCHLYTIGIHAGNLYGAVVETAEWCSHTGGVMVNKYVVEDEKIKLSEIVQSNVYHFGAALQYSVCLPISLWSRFANVTEHRGKEASTFEQKVFNNNFENWLGRSINILNTDQRVPLTFLILTFAINILNTDWFEHPWDWLGLAA